MDGTFDPDGFPDDGGGWHDHSHADELGDLGGHDLDPGGTDADHDAGLDDDLAGHDDDLAAGDALEVDRNQLEFGDEGAAPELPPDDWLSDAVRSHLDDPAIDTAADRIADDVLARALDSQ